MNAPKADWSKIEPILDKGMDTLDERDQAAALLRYFLSIGLK